MRTMIASFLSLMFPILSQAQPAPQGPPPALKLVASTKQDKGEIVIQETVKTVVPVQVEKIVLINGQPVREVVTEYLQEIRQYMVVVDVAKSRVITTDGKQLAIDEVWKRLKANTVFAMSADGKTPAQAYLKALNPDTLVVIAPAPMLNLPPVPVPPKIVVPPGAKN